jgi:hypothetical protein
MANRGRPNFASQGKRPKTGAERSRDSYARKREKEQFFKLDLVEALAYRKIALHGLKGETFSAIGMNIKPGPYRTDADRAAARKNFEEILRQTDWAVKLLKGDEPPE